MRMEPEDARRSFATAQFARLATADERGRPHIVPITFAVDGDRIHFAVDHKPKTTTRLRRLANITANPQVAVLVDHTDGDWGRLWWARADGRARIVENAAERDRALAALAARYPQYREHPPAGPAVTIDVERWSGWAAS